MDVAFTGLDTELAEKVAGALLPGTRLVPCAVDGLDPDAAGGYAAIILGPEIPLDAAMDTTRAIDHAHPETSVVLVAREDPETLKAAMRAGARDVWAPDVAPEDLSASLARLLEGSRQRSHLMSVAAEGHDRPAEVIAVLSAKGGVGQTMVATNLATFMADRLERSAAIVDLDLQFGDVAEVLQIHSEHHIADAVAALDNLPALKTMISEHPTGVHVIGVPDDPALGDDIAPAAAGRLIETLSSQFDVTIVDAGDGLSEHCLAALDHATSIVVVTTPDPFVVRDTQRMMGILDELQLAGVERKLVLNHASDRTGLKRRELDEVLAWPIDSAFASDPGIKATMSRGQSIEDASRGARKAIRHLAESLISGPDDNLVGHGR